jgi:hypothetical protein
MAIPQVLEKLLRPRTKREADVAAQFFCLFFLHPGRLDHGWDTLEREYAYLVEEDAFGFCCHRSLGWCRSSHSLNPGGSRSQRVP